ncbi:hypothetical protein [Puia sp.]|jgi:hypothetical protein|uniref:hypothetical protein n=1 Tax=Puia sp. TaxID=2045100 RepID=UPI002F41A5F3
MNPIYRLTLKSLRKAHKVLHPDTGNFGRNWKLFPNKQYASDLIADALLSPDPVMIARIGSNEALCVSNYLGVTRPARYKNAGSFIKGQTPPWWWEQSVKDHLHDVAGFFPVTEEMLGRFSELMLADLKNVDILGSWLKDEIFFREQLGGAKRVMLEDLEPFFVERPWTAALRGKKVLVVHPFEETIRQQYLRKDQLFDNGLLPEFELHTVKAALTLAGERSKYNNWFEALEQMKGEIAAQDYDICILGCGAYGLPLAAFVKSCGKKAIHLGGVTQLLFGIKGRRWENYIVYPYENLYNDYWVRPGSAEKPKNAQVVEGACYW